MALAKRRHVNREDVQAVVQIATESARPDLVDQIAIGRGDDPDVHSQRPRRAKALELSLLKDAKQLGLRVERQLADFIEEDGTAVRQLEAANLGRSGVGERAPLAAEELALDQRRRQRAAIHADESRVLA